VGVELYDLYAIPLENERRAPSDVLEGLVPHIAHDTTSPDAKCVRLWPMHPYNGVGQEYFQNFGYGAPE